MSDDMQRHDARSAGGKNKASQTRAGGKTYAAPNRESGRKNTFDKAKYAHRDDKRPHRPPNNAVPAQQRSDGTPSRYAAYKALTLVTRDKAYSGLALGRVLGEQHMSVQDKALATEIFYGTLEHIYKLDCLLRQLMAHEAEMAVMNVLRISAYQLLYLNGVPEHSVCDEAVNLTRRLGFESATGMVNGVLRNLVRKRDELKLPSREDDIEKYLSIEYSMPEFVCRRLIAQYGTEQTESILAWKSGRFITLRPNTLRISAAEFESSLDKCKLRFERSKVAGAYRVYDVGNIESNPLYKGGLCSVQGESSLLCAQVLDPKPGMQVLDACAAPGGKAAALAEIMQGSGRVYACDLHEHRVDLIRATAMRLKHDIIKPLMQDAARFKPEWKGSMDAVLCDVPCSGLGVISSKPDIALNISESELDTLPEVQLSILENCARYVKHGGELVYSTCTILNSENQNVVNAFLQRNTEFSLCDISQYVPDAFKGNIENGMVALLGWRDDVDGFFIAKMKRI